MGVLGWARNTFLFFPFKIMGNMVPLSDFLLSDLFSGTNLSQIMRVNCKPNTQWVGSHTTASIH